MSNPLDEVTDAAAVTYGTRPEAAFHLGPDVAWVCRMLQAGDTFYPTGSYAHSFGLEGLVAEGVVRDAVTLRRYLQESVLPVLRQSELPLATHAWKALGAQPDWTAVARLARLASALKTAREARQAAENVGAQRTELLARLHQSPLALEFLRRAGEEGWPHSSALAAALEGRVFGAPLEAMLAGICYATLSAQLAAAMKLLRLGQNAAQGLLGEMLAAAPALIAVAVTIPEAEIGWFNPWLDIAAARHETADARMFIS